MDPKDSDRNLFYLLLKKDGSTELPALDAAYSAPQQPINPAAAPSVPASSKLPAAPQQTISDPEALLVALQQPMDVSSATIEFPSAEPEHQQGLAGSETVAVEPRQPVVHFAEQESALHLHQPSEGNAAPQGLTSEQCDMMSTATCMQSGSGDLQQATAAEADTGAAGPLLEQAPHADQAQPPGSQSEHHVLHQLDEPELKPGIGSCNCDVPIMCNAGAWQTQAAPMQPPHTYKAEQEPQPILIQTHTSAAAQQPATSDQVDISHNHTAPSQFLQPPETAQSEARPAPWSHTSTQCQPALVVRHDNTPVQQQLQQIHQPSEGITRAPTSCPAPEASPPTDASAAEPPTHPEQPQSANIPPDTLPGNQSVSPDPQLPAQTLALGVPLTSGADTNLVPPGAGLAAVAVTSPRQGELRGVLGAACSQIIAKQQARSPNAFLQHQSPRGASPTQQHPLSPTSIQHLTDHHIVKAGSSQHGVLHIHYDDAPSPGRQATHSPVQQAVHHTGQLPVQQAPQPPEQLPLDRSQELEDEWTNMLIDLPETAQHDAAQMPSVDHLGALEVSSPLSSTPTASFPCLLNADQHAQDHLEVADVEMQDAADASDPSDSLMHPPASAAAPEAQPPEAELQQPTAESDRGLPKVTLPSQQMPAVVIDIQYHGRTGSLTEAGQLPSEQPSPKPSVVPPTAPPPSVIHQDTRMGLQQSDEALDATTSTDVSAMVDCTHLHADQQQLALQQSAQYANPLKLDEGDVASAGAEQAAQPDEAPTDQQDACEHDAALQEPPADLTEQATLDDVGTEAEAERPHTRSTRLSQSAIMNQEAVLEKPAAPADHASNVPTALSLPEQSSQPDPEASELEAEHTAVAKEMHRTDPNSSVHAVASPPALLEQACDEPMQLDASPSDLPQSSEPHQDEQDADHVLVAASASAWDTATDRPRTRLRRSLESATIRQLLQDTAPAEQQMATCAAASDVHKPTQPPCQAELLSAAQLEDTVVDDTADAVAREKPHTRLRRSLQGAAESPSIAAKDAKAISPQCKLKSKLQQKSPTHKPKQQDQHAKHGSRAGTLRKPQSPQYTPAAKHQPQQQLVQQAPSGKSPSKASSKGMAVVKNGKRKRSGLHHVEARDDTPAVGPSSKLSKSPAAEQKRSSIPR